MDEAALVAALEGGQIGGAGLDVTENEPFIHPGLKRANVVLAPAHRVGVIGDAGRKWRA